MPNSNKYNERYYKEKYIKYKSKYFEAKQRNLIGGNDNNPAL
uniref:Uncharacterized protein n=1 Tax=viral metagenome TaxID=1070528 RepID=A0A6C0C8Y6_9ZZZZ